MEGISIKVAVGTVRERGGTAVSRTRVAVHDPVSSLLFSTTRLPPPLEKPFRCSHNVVGGLVLLGYPLFFWGGGSHAAGLCWPCLLQ